MVLNVYHITLFNLLITFHVQTLPVSAIYDHMDLISTELPTQLAEVLMKEYNPAKERIELNKLLGFSEVNKTSRLINYIVQAEPDLKKNFSRLLPTKGSPILKGQVFTLLFQKIGV